MRRFLNHISLYRFTLYYLVVLIAAAGLLAFWGILPYRPVDLIFSTSLIVVVCLACNWVFAKSFGMTSNRLSAFITGLILALIITPVAWTDIDGIGFVIFSSSWAIASKYIIVVGKRRIFNPAAFGVAFASIALAHSASWWIGGNMFLLPILLTGGALILYKLRCLGLVASFTSVALITIAATMPQGHGWAAASQMLLHSMLLFFAFVMLTEPRTMPLGRWRRLAYGLSVFFSRRPFILDLFTSRRKPRSSPETFSAIS